MYPAMKQDKFELEFRPSQRREPRGIDEQWAANAAELEKWRSGDIAIPKNLDDRHPESRRSATSRARPARARGLWLTVIVGGLSVGGLLLYLLITLSGIGPPKELRQPDARAKVTPVEAATEASRSSAGTVRTSLDDQRRPADKRPAASR
jgi:hypothetical protein